MVMDFFNSINKHLIKDNFIKDWDMEKVKWNIHQEILIKETGKMIKNMDMVLWIGLLKIKNIKENG
jgi:hypothetical protein